MSCSLFVCWLVALGIYVASVVFHPYRDLEAGDNQCLKIQVARPGIEPDPLAPQAKTTHKFIHNNILIDLNTMQ